MNRPTFSFFDMTRPERRAALILIVLIVFLTIFRFFVPKLFGPDPSCSEKEFVDLVDQLFSDTLSQQTKNPIREEPERTELEVMEKGKTTPGRYLPRTTAPSGNTRQGNISLHEFDPNVAGYEELLSLGLSVSASKNLIRYRERGGRFEEPSDLLCIYGLDTPFFQRIVSFIRIPETGERHKVSLILDVNRADTSEWTQLKGIGPVYAQRICRYRDLLGGFIGIEQMKEVYNLPVEVVEENQNRLFFDTMLVRKIDLNFAEKEELARHPYCGWENAKRIIRYRTQNGNFITLSPLLSDSVLSVETYEKLAPYLSVSIEK